MILPNFVSFKKTIWWYLADNTLTVLRQMKTLYAGVARGTENPDTRQYSWTGKRPNTMESRCRVFREEKRA